MIQSTTLRDSLIGGACAVVVLALLVYGIVHMSEKPAGNTLTGMVVEKEFTPQKEQQVELQRAETRRREGDPRASMC